MKLSVDDLSRIDLFQDIEFNNVPVELEQAEIKEFSPEDVVISPENENTSIYFLLSGQLGVHLESPTSQMLRTIETGDCVGELSVIEQRPL